MTKSVTDVLKTPMEWLKGTGITIWDYDGWTRAEWAAQEPTTSEDFWMRLSKCTVSGPVITGRVMNAMSLQEVLQSGLPDGDEGTHQALAERFGVKETDTLLRARAIRRRVRQILHIQQHQEAFNEVHGKALDVELYFVRYGSYIPNLYMIVCRDLKVEPIRTLV